MRAPRTPPRSLASRRSATPVGTEPRPLADGTLPGEGSKDSSPITRF
nr:MAG TPA: hypothetical protein [Caudoviricetes sp.]